MQQYLNPGDAHPFNGVNNNINNGMIAPPPLPGQQYTNMFMPSIMRDPMVDGINAGSQIGSYASQAVPAASVFQSQLYNPNLNPMEQNFLGAGAGLGQLGLNSAMNRLDQQYEGSPDNSGRGQQYMDAANQFALGQVQTAMSAGLQRQQMATQNLPTAFGTPLSANAHAQESASNLNTLANVAMGQEMQYPLAAYNSQPVQTPTLIQNQSSGGGGFFGGLFG